MSARNIISAETGNGKDVTGTVKSMAGPKTNFYTDILPEMFDVQDLFLLEDIPYTKGDDHVVIKTTSGTYTVYGVLSFVM